MSYSSLVMKIGRKKKHFVYTGKGKHTHSKHTWKVEFKALIHTKRFRAFQEGS